MNTENVFNTNHFESNKYSEFICGERTKINKKTLKKKEKKKERNKELNPIK